MTTDSNPPPLDCILVGDCLEQLKRIPDASIDLIVADPPYNNDIFSGSLLARPDGSEVAPAKKADWDVFQSNREYDEFNRAWLVECRRVLKTNGALWVCGTYHCIHRIGTVLMDEGWWFLGEVTWAKTNAMPNFLGNRFPSSHETFLWMSPAKGRKYTFNYRALKELNGGKQMRSYWELPICSGKERLRDAEGKILHPTQKPEKLIYRILLGTSNPGDVVLDPFFGTGTTGAVAKKMGRRWIGIERRPDYAAAAQARIDAVEPDAGFQPEEEIGPATATLPDLIAADLVQPGRHLTWEFEFGRKSAILTPQGKLIFEDQEYSLEELSQEFSDGQPCPDPLDHWHYLSHEDERIWSLSALAARMGKGVRSTPSQTPLERLMEAGLIQPGDEIGSHPMKAIVNADGTVQVGSLSGSLDLLTQALFGDKNPWQKWYIRLDGRWHTLSDAAGLLDNRGDEK